MLLLDPAHPESRLLLQSLGRVDLALSLFGLAWVGLPLSASDLVDLESFLLLQGVSYLDFALLALDPVHADLSLSEAFLALSQAFLPWTLPAWDCFCHHMELDIWDWYRLLYHSHSWVSSHCFTAMGTQGLQHWCWALHILAFPCLRDRSYALASRCCC